MATTAEQENLKRLMPDSTCPEKLTFLGDSKIEKLDKIGLG